MTSGRASRLVASGLGLLALAGAAALPGCKGCRKPTPAKPWARALPRTTAAHGLPEKADARITVRRKQLLLSGKPLLGLNNGRLPPKALRDGVDGLFVPALARALAKLVPKINDKKRGGSLEIACQPAAPFRTVRAVLYTAMRAGFTRPWLLAESAKGKRVALPLELPSVTGNRGHGLRTSRARIPAFAVGYDGRRIHLTRFGRSACPGTTPGASSAAAGCASLGTGLSAKGLGRLQAHLGERQKSARRPGRPPPDQAVMIWAGLEVPMGDFVRLLDALRTVVSKPGSCQLEHDDKTGRWRLRRGTDRGCLHHQTVVVWSRPGHRTE